MDQIREYLSQNQDRFVNELIELLKIPSVSADSAFSQDVLNTAEAVAGALREAGCALVLEHLKKKHDAMHHLFEEVPCYISIQDQDLKVTKANKKFKYDLSPKSNHIQALAL